MYDRAAQHARLSYKFTGKERDPESNLDNFGARYDSSAMGRFMSPDPLASAGADLVDETNPQSWNAYSYVLNNPLSNVDPDGLDCVFVQDNTVWDASGDCTGIKNGTYVPGTVDKNSVTYDPNTGTLGLNYTPYGGGIGSETIRGVYPSSGVSDSDLFNAVAQGTQMSRPIVEPAFWATMGFLATFGPGILESSLALPGAGLTIPGGGLVIGKMGDLGNLGPGEHTLDLPDQGNPKGNWAQNASKLRQAMNDGQPIRDASAGKPGSDTGFLRAERNVLQNHGWTLQSDGYWHPPGK